MDDPIDGTCDKLRLGFVLAGGLKEIEISSGDRPKPTYVSAKSNPEYNPELINLLKGI